MRINDVIDIIGEEPTETLCRRLGGVRVYIPRVPNPKSRIALAIGHANLAKLCDQMPTEHIYLPSRNSSECKAKKEEIMFDSNLGVPSSECAIRHGVSAQYINKIKRLNSVKSN